jgi:pyridoxamine 5'-phosphate oxidase-like protein
MLDSRMAAVAFGARFAYVAVETKSGPHVTPVLHAPAAGAAWFLVPRSTLKARVLRARPRAGLLLRCGERSLVLGGRVRLLDPLRPDASPATLARAGSAPLALGAYSLRNPRELAGFALDALRLPGRSLPPNLLLAAFEPDRVALVSADAVETSRGGWPEDAGALPAGRPKAGARDRAPFALPDLPDEVADLPLEDGPAVLGWMTSAGPIALPASWDAAAMRATVSAELLEACGASPEAPACLTFDAADSARPTGKRGLMIRGEGRVLEVDGSGARVSVEPDGVTHWAGFDAGTALPSR